MVKKLMFASVVLALAISGIGPLQAQRPISPTYCTPGYPCTSQAQCGYIVEYGYMGVCQYGQCLCY